MARGLDRPGEDGYLCGQCFTPHQKNDVLFGTNRVCTSCDVRQAVHRRAFGLEGFSRLPLENQGGCAATGAGKHRGVVWPASMSQLPQCRRGGPKNTSGGLEYPGNGHGLGRKFAPAGGVGGIAIADRQPGECAGVCPLFARRVGDCFGSSGGPAARSRRICCCLCQTLRTPCRLRPAKIGVACNGRFAVQTASGDGSGPGCIQ